MKGLSSVVIPCVGGVAFSAYNLCGERGLLPEHCGWITPSLKSGLFCTAGMSLCSLATKSPVKAFTITAFTLSWIAINNSQKEARQNRIQWDNAKEAEFNKKIAELFERTKPEE